MPHDKDVPTGPPPEPDPFGRWMMTIMAGLVAAGVAGLWQLSTSVARLDERLGNWISVSERLFNQVARDLREVDRRLDAVERDHPPLPQRRPEEDSGGRYALPPPSDRRQ